MMLTRIFGVAFIFISLISNQAIVGAQTIGVPAPVGDIYVQDFANVLSQSEIYQLRNYGREIESRTTAQVAVLTIDTIGDLSMEEFANEAFRQYGIGRKKENNGVLLVIAMNDRKVRIEVGYGLEGRLPDGKVGQILDEYTIPYLQNGQANKAVIETYKVLSNEVLTEYGEEGLQTAPEQTTPITTPNSDNDRGGGIPSWLLIILVIVIVFLDLKFFGGFLTYMLLSIISRGGAGGGGGGGNRGGGGGSSGGGGAGRNW